MPLTHFKCPDGETRPLSACYDCPRPEGRCLSLPTLKTLGSPRIWRGKPSTTQLLNPTRLEYLQITKPYAVDPFDQAFALLGTRHHGRLEQVAKQIEGLEAELYLQGDVSGVLDLLEPLKDGTYRLVDYKTFGSYAVNKQLADEDKQGDKRKLALQMNNYRLGVEKLGFKVSELRVQITVRDGNTFSARNNKVTENIYFLPVEIMPDDDVADYFQDKAYKLCTAVEKGEMPPICSYDERWGSRRCKGYCPVVAWCKEGSMVAKIEYLGG